jgi:hypothetical protein
MLVSVPPVLRRRGKNMPPRLHTPGKLGSRRGVNSFGGLTYLTDSLSNTRFLVDTGAAVSVLSYKGSSSCTATQDGQSLAGADGASIKSWGKIYKSVCFGGRLFTDVPFIQAAVNKPILGADFFSRHKLLVDTAGNRVLDVATLLPLSEPAGNKGTGLVAALSAVPPPVRSLFAEFPSVVGDGSDTPRPLHGIQHTVETKGRLLFAKSRRLDPDKLRTAEKEFLALEKVGIVRRSNSGWSSPLHMVPKADGSFRPCGDLQDFTANLAGCTIFSKIDLVKGYHQVQMAENDIPKTAICTPFGLFEYIFMPFGLKNAAQTFQRLMDKLFRHLPFKFVYLDDILIASRDLAKHMRHLRQVFKILQDAGLQINPAKCTFSVSSLTFLGHNVDSSSISPMEKHVKALTDFPPPSDLKHLQRFLGLINFYRRFLPEIAGTLQPLTDLLRGNPKTLVWSESAAAAFCAAKAALAAAKAALAAATALVHPFPGAVISLATDASDTHIGGVLQQLSARSWRPLAFFSRKLSSPESKYSTFADVRHFRFVLEGRLFRILTDHLPLTLAMRRVSPLWSARQVQAASIRVQIFGTW